MLKKTSSVLLAAVLSSFACAAYADRSEGAATARQGTMRCGGNHFLRLAGSEIQFTSWVFRNFDSTQSITLDRLRVFDANGATLFDSASSTLPPSEEGNIGPGNNVLAPNMTVQFNSEDVLPAFLTQQTRPVQLELQWSSAQKVLTLDGITVRVSRQRDPSTGAQLAERGRHAIDCRTIATR
ncbi:MAG TPA: hypothetical protein VHP37_24075 [Burkholderiales bacterium]|nr:hypothetical protein [Burkholderiales bacterium]